MDVLRRNTDYALRMMVSLAKNFNSEPMSAKQLATEGNFSYQLSSKLLQKLHKAKLVTSIMGPRGGFVLNKEPSKITLMDIINPIQGCVRMNKCLLGGPGCEFKADCPINTKLSCLQLYIDGYLGGITLKELLGTQKKRRTKNGKSKSKE